jgi:hypothetical protein
MNPLPLILPSCFCARKRSEILLPSLTVLSFCALLIYPSIPAPLPACLACARQRSESRDGEALNSENTDNTMNSNHIIYSN